MAQRDSIADGRSSPDNDGARHFVNDLRIGLSLSEIHLDLASMGNHARSGMPLWRFVTTPDHLQIMHQDLVVAIDRYTARFGPIHAARTASPSITFSEDGEHG